MMNTETTKISIIGLGLIGGSIAKALKNSGRNFHISAYDKSSVLKKAKEQKVIDTLLEEPEDAINSDIIFLCLPLEFNLKYFKSISPLLNEDTIITDVSGIKLVFQKRPQNIGFL